MARPSKRTPELIAKLEYAFSIGCSNPEACLYADIAESTYYDWMLKDTKLSERFTLLKTKPVLEARKVVMDDIINEGDVNTAKWFLERRSPDFKPSSKHEVTGADGGALRTETSITFKGRGKDE